MLKTDRYAFYWTNLKMDFYIFGVFCYLFSEAIKLIIILKVIVIVLCLGYE